MKKTILFVGMVFFVMPLFCEAVKSDVLTSKYGVSYTERQRSNYIEKNGYSFQYLGNGTWDVKNVSQNKASFFATNGDKNATVIIIVVSIIHIILTFCVYKMKGPYFACFYFFLAPLALVGLALFATKDAGSIKPDKNHITITHRHQ